MSSFNKVILLGNVTRNPDVRYTPKGTAVAEIGLALNRKYTTDSGEKREDVTFVDATAFGRTAEILGEYVKKGDPLHLEGRLQLDTWDDKATGQKRSKLKVIIENIQLISSGKREQRQGERENAEHPPRRESPPRRPSSPPQRPQDPDLDQAAEDEIPF